MRKRRAQRPHPGEDLIDDAIGAMEAGELREVVREMLLELDDLAHARIVNRLIERAARTSTDWVPASPSDVCVSEALAFAQAAKQDGWAEPHEVDSYLNHGARAFLAKDYPAAFQIFRALLIPLAACEIDLGQHESIDEVLGTCVTQCARQYVVSMYMTASPGATVAIWTAPLSTWLSRIICLIPKQLSLLFKRAKPSMEERPSHKGRKFKSVSLTSFA